MTPMHEKVSPSRGCTGTPRSRGEHQHVFEVGFAAGGDEDAVGHAAQQHPGRLTDPGLDQIEVADAELGGDPLDLSPSLPGRGAIGGLHLAPRRGDLVGG